jgi:hypothetical protein
MRKLLLNLTPGEPLALMKKLPCFDDPIEFDSLLVGVLCLGVHDLIKFTCLMQEGLSSVGANCSATSEVSRRGGKYGRSSSTLNTGASQGKEEYLIQNNSHPQPW